MEGVIEKSYNCIGPINIRIGSSYSKKKG